MRVFRVPEKLRAVLFDMDATLYENADYERAQVDLPVERLARLRGKSVRDMAGEIARLRESLEGANGGRKTSLANVFAALGVGIEESVRWRNELLRPEDFLREDALLRAALARLAGSFALAVVTNNPGPVAERTLAALGVADLFRGGGRSRVVGLGACGVSKPHAAPYLMAAALCGAEPEACLSAGDRYDIDIAIPLELGMGGILVEGVGDVYGLPDLLLG